MAASYMLGILHASAFLLRPREAALDKFGQLIFSKYASYCLGATTFFDKSFNWHHIIAGQAILESYYRLLLFFWHYPLLY